MIERVRCTPFMELNVAQDRAIGQFSAERAMWYLRQSSAEVVWVGGCYAWIVTVLDTDEIVLFASGGYGSIQGQVQAAKGLAEFVTDAINANELVIAHVEYPERVELVLYRPVDLADQGNPGYRFDLMEPTTTMLTSNMALPGTTGTSLHIREYLSGSDFGRMTQHAKRAVTNQPNFTNAGVEIPCYGLVEFVNQGRAYSIGWGVVHDDIDNMQVTAVAYNAGTSLAARADNHNPMSHEFNA